MQYVSLAKSLTDAATYLVNDVADPLQRSLTSLHLADVLLGGPPTASSSTFPPPSGDALCPCLSLIPYP